MSSILHSTSLPKPQVTSIIEEMQSQNSSSKSFASISPTEELLSMAQTEINVEATKELSLPQKRKELEPTEEFVPAPVDYKAVQDGLPAIIDEGPDSD